MESVLTQESSLMRPPLLGRSGKAEYQGKGSNWDQRGQVQCSMECCFHSLSVFSHLLHHLYLSPPYYSHFRSEVAIIHNSFSKTFDNICRHATHWAANLIGDLSDKNILQLIIRHKPPDLLNPNPPFCYERYPVILCFTSPLLTILL